MIVKRGIVQIRVGFECGVGIKGFRSKVGWSKADQAVVVIKFVY